MQHTHCHCLEVELLEEVSNSSLGLLLLVLILLQVATTHSYKTLLTSPGRSWQWSSEPPSSCQPPLPPWAEQRSRTPQSIYHLREWLHHKPGGHEVLKIHNLGEHSHLSSLVDLLLRHASGDLARSALHTDNHSIRELMLIAATLVHTHNDGLLTGILARQNDNNLSGLKTLHHLHTNKTLISIQTYGIRFPLE